MLPSLQTAFSVEAYLTQDHITDTRGTIADKGRIPEISREHPFTEGWDRTLNYTHTRRKLV
jgi:hypothetical protein